uniref:Uncharacterized protein n=1 Tax=Strigamia maritima TaxID=126957 RepID=T1ING3_STRMM
MMLKPHYNGSTIGTCGLVVTMTTNTATMPLSLPTQISLAVRYANQTSLIFSRYLSSFQSTLQLLLIFHSYFTLLYLHSYFTLLYLHSYFTLLYLHSYFTLLYLHSYFTLLYLHSYFTLLYLHSPKKKELCHHEEGNSRIAMYTYVNRLSFLFTKLKSTKESKMTLEIREKWIFLKKGPPRYRLSSTF